MAGKITLRELITRWRFKTDSKAVSDFARGLGNAKITAEGVGRSIAGMGKAIALGMAATAAALGYALKKSIDVAAEAEESESKFAAVFKRDTKDMSAWSEKFAAAAGRSAFELRDQASTFGALFNAMKFGGKESANLSTHMVKLVEDLASFNNEAAPDVLIALRSGLLGNVEPVLKYGADVRVAAVNQELLNMGIKGGAKKATEQQKVLARLSIIMRATKDAQGDAIKTSGSWTNMMKGLHAAIKDVQILVGSRLIPALKPYLKGVMGAVAGTASWLKANQKLVDQNIGAVMEGLADGWRGLTGDMKPGDFEDVGKSIGDALRYMGIGLKWTIKIAKGLWEWLTLPFRMAAQVLAAAGMYVYEFGAIFFETFDQVTAKGMSTWDRLAAIFRLGQTMMTAPFRLVYSVASAALDSVWGAFKRTFPGIAGTISGALKPIVQWFKDLPNTIWIGLVDGFQRALQALAGYINAAKGKLGKVGDMLFGKGGVSLPQMMMPSPAAAAAGGGAPVTVQQTVQVTVPPGTPASLADRTGEAVKQSTARDLRRGISDVRR